MCDVTSVMQIICVASKARINALVGGFGSYIYVYGGTGLSDGRHGKCVFMRAKLNRGPALLCV